MAEDFLTINNGKSVETKKWIISLNDLKPVKQASVNIDGKSYDFTSVYDVKEGDVVVIGVKNDSEKRGEMGLVEKVLNKPCIDIEEAADLAFVFSDDPDKAMIDACKDYIENAEDVDSSDEFEIFPVSYKVRKLIAASCIVAYPELSTEEDVDMAKMFISKPQHLDDVPMPSPLGLCEIELYDSYAANSPYIGEGWIDGSSYFDMEGDELEELEEEFSKKVFCETIAIMLRGGFVNLLEALLSSDPPITDYYEDIVNSVDNAFIDKAMSVLKTYGSSR